MADTPGGNLRHPTEERVKTSLALNREKYDQLRIYSVTHRVPLRDIFDEAMDLYLAIYVNRTAGSKAPPRH
ncbi:ribbon-helix-helix domain-containing protein [Corynebacterium jeikeium]|uniref:ribbon-helix-helix domain-containing protein n=1 Tax=Corynebacterium jeikeium TaxID=38289 RepID=UPI000884328F|nr:Ribbon-helix-helix domain protein [Corynebacterium jeikeium]